MGTLTSDDQHLTAINEFGGLKAVGTHLHELNLERFTATCVEFRCVVFEFALIVTVPKFQFH